MAIVEAQGLRHGGSTAAAGSTLDIVRDGGTGVLLDRAERSSDRARRRTDGDLGRRLFERLDAARERERFRTKQPDHDDQQYVDDVLTSLNRSVDQNLLEARSGSGSGTQIFAAMSPTLPCGLPTHRWSLSDAPFGHALGLPKVLDELLKQQLRRSTWRWRSSALRLPCLEGDREKGSATTTGRRGFPRHGAPSRAAGRLPFERTSSSSAELGAAVPESRRKTRAMTRPSRTPLRRLGAAH